MVSRFTVGVTRLADYAERRRRRRRHPEQEQDERRVRWGHGISRRWIPAFGAWSRELTEKKMASDRAPEFLGSRYLAGQRARAAVRRKEAELIDLRRFPNGRRVRWMGGSASDARWVVRARTHLCRTTADARRRSRPRTQQALHSRWNFTALEELCTLVVDTLL